MGTTNILIVDGFHRIGLAVARSLKLAGDYTIHLVTHRGGWSDSVQRAFKSNAVDTLRFTRIDSGDDGFLACLLRLIEAHRVDFVMPAGHHGTVHTAFLKTALSRVCTVLVPDYEKIQQLHDKRETVRLARRVGIPHPRTFMPANDAEAEACARVCTYPAVVKARKGDGADGVWYAGNERELMRALRGAAAARGSCDGVARDTSAPMIQEFIPGELHDVAAFCSDGRVEAALTQKRVLTKPLSGGKGIVNITTFNPELLDIARDLVRRTRWSGVLLFDFKVDRRDGIPKLLEVNPRFWGTTWLTTCAGFNFPHNMILAARGKPLRFPPRYRVGLACRWPLYEIGTILERPRSAAVLFERTKAFLSRFRWKNCVYDILASDPKPFAADCITRVVWTLQSVGRRREQDHGNPSAGRL
jgi:predicted ATP-grasp superfamily ATP-dependent carboligase